MVPSAKQKAEFWDQIAMEMAGVGLHQQSAADLKRKKEWLVSDAKKKYDFKLIYSTFYF